MLSENYSFKSPCGHQSWKALKRSSHILAVKQPWYISTQAVAATAPTWTVVLSLYPAVLRNSLIITAVCRHSPHSAKALLLKEEWLSMPCFSYSSSNMDNYSSSALRPRSHTRFKMHLKTLKWKGEGTKGVQCMWRSYDKMCIPCTHREQTGTHPLHIHPHPQCSLLPYGLGDRCRCSFHSQGWCHKEHLSGTDC